ncbi:zinc finger domain-containing protein [Arthrospira platensis SPKY2]
MIIKTKKEIKDRIKELHPDIRSNLTKEEREELIKLTEELNIFRKEKDNKNKIKNYLNELLNLIKKEEIEKRHRECIKCKGTGKKLLNKCTNCNGKGIYYSKETINNMNIVSIQICPNCKGIGYIKSEEKCEFCIEGRVK